MPEEKEPPRPHGDKLPVGNHRDEAEDSPRGQSENGAPELDEDDGAQRKRQYKDGAELVSGID